MNQTDYSSAIALVAMSGRYPGADSVQRLWDNLLHGRSGLRELTDDELLAAGADPIDLADPRYVRVGGPVQDIELFDAGVFGFSPREAQTLEPQHRLVLECCWEALESAGYCPTDMPGQVGVFAGMGFPDYLVKNLMRMATTGRGGVLRANTDATPSVIAVGNERDSLTSLVSYKLGLRGPAVTVQTFCSTSLVAVHLACQSLLTYECDLALAGGAFTPLPQPAGYLFEPDVIRSPDGRVRSFDAAANGTVMGSGAGIVALKRMPDALADGDVIHAVILGSATNNDGRARAGYTAPGVDGQAEVIETALCVAGVKPDTIGYLECHATGTMLGDSIELAAISRVFAHPSDNPTVLGSVKPSIGHLDRAAGVTGLIRATLNLEHELLPGTPNYRMPNPVLAGAQDRLTVLAEHRPWPRGPHPRRAGVSSFGLGGANAHVVLEQAPQRPPRPHRPGPHLLTFSAADETALAELTQRLRAHLDGNRDVDLADVAFTLQSSRGGFALRRAVVCADHDDAVAALSTPDRWVDGTTRRSNPGVTLSTSDGSVAAWLTELGVRVVDSGGAVRIDAADGTARARLCALAKAWIAGAVIDWARLHSGEGRRVELPTYPFQRRRYWVDPTDLPTGKLADRAQWTYLPTWGPRPLPVDGLDHALRQAGPWLVFAAERRGENLVRRLVSAGAAVVTARPGKRFERVGADRFTVRVDDRDDHARLLGSLAVAPRTIVHGFSLATHDGTDFTADFEAEQCRGYHSALALAGALAGDDDPTATELVLLTSGAVGVVGTDLRHPEHATLAAIAPTLAQENPRLRCRHLDVDDEEAATQVLAGCVAQHEGPLAIRAGEAWLRRYQQHPLEPAGVIGSGDTVLVTGGLGDVGLILARHLAETHGCNLVLTTRTDLPDRERWPDHLAAVPEGGERAARHIANILDLEARGATVLAISADVSDLARMHTVVDTAVATFGGIDVVIHGAGVQDVRLLTPAHRTDRATTAAHLAAKVTGFHVLQQVLGARCPNRRITLSSLTGVLGGVGFAAYAAANAAFDAYARVARLAGAGRWITVDWDSWTVAQQPGAGDPAMQPDEAVDVFERVLAAGDRIGHVAVSTTPLDARIATWVTGGIHRREEPTEPDTPNRHPRPELTNAFAAPRDGTETVLAEIWSAVLGIEPVGATDNFFELGGHSLLAIDLTARIRRHLAAAIPISALLTCPTVRRLAELIDAG